MKKLFLLAALALPLSASLTACGKDSVTTPDDQAYRVQLSSVGYEVDDKEKITVADVTVNLTSMAGAPDVNHLEYTGTLLNSEYKPATEDNSYLTKISGTLLTDAKGGYKCTATAEALCTYGSPDAVYVNNSTWTRNTVNRSLYPGEWAAAHWKAYKKPSGESAQWYVKFDYTAYASNGKVYTWSQNYPFIIPVKAN